MHKLNFQEMVEASLIKNDEVVLQLIDTMDVEDQFVQEFLLITKKKRYKFTVYTSVSGHGLDDIELDGIQPDDGIQIGDEQWSIEELISNFVGGGPDIGSKKPFKINVSSISKLKKQHYLPQKPWEKVRRVLNR